MDDTRGRGRRGYVLGLLLAGGLIGLGGCATIGQGQGQAKGPAEFPDIPVTQDFTLVEDRTLVIESPSVKAGRIVYRAQVKEAGLVSYFREAMLRQGWRLVSATRMGNEGTTLAYQQEDKSAVLRIREGWLSSTVEIVVTDVLRDRKGPAAGRAESGAVVVPGAARDGNPAPAREGAQAGPAEPAAPARTGGIIERTLPEPSRAAGPADGQGSPGTR
ncbi:MAG: hypothetical protein HYV08_05265 [Deltaproteobacteria bacterium]|nr:hypothetical protein [Deltaproteobacteria bacterium]